MAGQRYAECIEPDQERYPEVRAGLMHLMDDLSPLTSTIKFRSKRYDFRRRYWAVGRRVFNLNSKPSCQTRSKASLTSRKTAELYCLRRFPMCLLWGSMVTSKAELVVWNGVLHTSYCHHSTKEYSFEYFREGGQLTYWSVRCNKVFRFSWLGYHRYHSTLPLCGKMVDT